MNLISLSHFKCLLLNFSNLNIISFFQNYFCGKAFFKHFLILSFFFLSFFFGSIAISADITIGWDSNTENDLAGYILYYGTSSGYYDHTEDVGNVTRYTLENLQEGITYYFAAKAYDLTGHESDFSEELVYTLSNTPNNGQPATPSMPSGPTSGHTDTLNTFVTNSSDPDGDSLEYIFDWGNDDLSSWGSPSRTYAWSIPGNFCIRSMARDPNGETSEWSNCHNITITTSHQDRHTITAAASINGRISPSGSLSINHGANQAFTVIPDENCSVRDVLVDGVSVGAVTSYMFTEVVQNHTISAVFSLNNTPPIADAGPNQTASEGALVTLSANYSSDSEGNIVSYFWEQTRGPRVQLSDPQGMQTTFVAPKIDSWGATLRFRLAVLDEMGLQGIDYCRVFVTQEAFIDEDGDGVPDSEDAFPLDPNEWLDTDDDGIGNNGDEDDDQDGLPDVWELLYGLDPLTSDGQEDPDGDGIANIDEYYNESDPTIFQNNLAPNQPEIFSPINDSLVDLIPVLDAGEFYDDNVNDYHTGTQWQIFEETNDLCILNINTGVSLTSLNVPRLILDENTNYYWKVRYFDNAGRPSKWSEPAYFLTDANIADANNDGVPDHQEVEGIQDLDSDGIDDESQDDIKIMKSEVGTANIGISVKESDNVLELVSIEAEDPSKLQSNPAENAPTPPVDLPFGLINYKIIVEQPGDEAVISVYLSEAAPEGSKCYKYDPIESAWFDYSAYSEFSEDRKSFTLLVKDGGSGDLDGIENGIIIDPAGVGLNMTGNDSIATSSGGGSAGCFIGTTAPKHQISLTIKPSSRWKQIIGILPILLIIFGIVGRRKWAFNFYEGSGCFYPST